MSKIRFTLVTLGIATAVASVPALAVTGAVENDGYAVAKEITIPPGGDAGWQTSPGSAVVIVKKGTLTLAAPPYPSYETETYVAGDAYLDPGHRDVSVGRNEGTAPLEIVVVNVALGSDA